MALRLRFADDADDPAPTNSGSIRIDPLVLDAMRDYRQRYGTPIKRQIEFAMREWFERQAGYLGRDIDGD